MTPWISFLILASIGLYLAYLAGRLSKSPEYELMAELFLLLSIGFVCSAGWVVGL